MDGAPVVGQGTTDPRQPNAASPTVSDATPHRRILEDFIAAIRGNTTPACDGREGRAASPWSRPFTRRRRRNDRLQSSKEGSP